MKRHSSLVFGLVSLLVASVSWGQEVSGRWHVIHAGTLLSSPGEPPLRNQTLIINDDRIDRIVSGFVTPESLALDNAETMTLEVRTAGFRRVNVGAVCMAFGPLRGHSPIRVARIGHI